MLRWFSSSSSRSSSTTILSGARFIRRFSSSSLKTHQHQHHALRCVTLDVTGTLIRFTGSLGEYYCEAAEAVCPGRACPDTGHKRVSDGFHKAYSVMCELSPCFGKDSMTSKQWWNEVVRLSFSFAGYQYTETEMQKIFERIYALFGSKRPYEAFDDSLPFLRWCKMNQLKLGIVSNGTERYRHEILPLFGLTEGVDFVILAREVGFEKPDLNIFEAAFAAASRDEDGLTPKQILHIGDSVKKDYVPATTFGMQAILLDRFGSGDADECRRQGLNVLRSLTEVQSYLVERHLLSDERNNVAEDRKPASSGSIR